MLVLGIAVASAWNLTRPAQTRAAADCVFGVADPTLLNESASAQVAQLKAMKAMGITSVRVDANWYWWQPNGPDSFDWGTLDQAMASIH